MSLAANLSALIACSLVAVSPAAAAQEQLPSSGSEAGDRGTDDRQAKAGADAAADDGAGNVVPGEILVKFEEGVSPERIETINRRLGATVVNRMLEGRLVLVTIPYPSATSQLIDAYAATEGVEYAEPNQEVSLYPPPENVGTAPSPPESGNRGGGLPPPNEDGSAPLIPLPGPR